VAVRVRPEPSADAPEVLVVDNYDSFVHNLVQYLGELGASPRVVRNDAPGLLEVVDAFDGPLLLSPGPGHPADAGLLCEVISRAMGRLPMLGVCLGHQAIAHVCGARVVRAPELRHGRTSPIHHDGTGIFADLPSPLEATRYHSLAVDPGSVPSTLRVTARTQDGVVMALRHARLPVEGVQFHPESILTAHGHAMLRNYLVTASSWWSRPHAPR
jgi:anthranilate synthase/aminodeoxychorismate synthase-like glutamine amidotransferase